MKKSKNGPILTRESESKLKLFQVLETQRKLQKDNSQLLN